ncbi:GNAT family N-acetyltransferase [Geomicrobium sp. JCM 19038]|uniref:GNAT family N-acetyltransferase n=1 Tax=Geomicrobium sp. JCM 19038 TaxID=1460635 RepID=UPI000693DE7F|nr:GNAT family N-acetyltransferase [Geomicrobium sp. JCM 19038]
MLFYAKKRHERFTLFSPSTGWDEFFETVQTENTMKMSRVVYHLNEEVQLQSSFKLPVYEINKHSIVKSQQFDECYYVEQWGSVEAYLKYGIGYYAENEIGEIVAECTSIFRSKGKANIDIYTREDARGKGIASELVLGYVRECRKRKITPVWDCDEVNEASMQLANKLGFSEVSRYHLYYKKSP